MVVGSVRYETAIADPERRPEHGRDSQGERPLNDLDGEVRIRAFRRQHRIVAPDVAEHALQLAGVGHTSRQDLQVQALGCLERLGDHRRGAQVDAVIDEPDPADRRRERLENFQTLGHELGLETRHPRHVATGLAKPVDDAGAYRVTHQGEHDGHALRRVPRGVGSRLLAREDQVDAGLDEGRGGGSHRVQLSLGEADVERHVAAVYEAELLEPGLEPFDGRMARRPRGVEDADAERARGLLGLAHVGGQPEKNRHGDPEAARRFEVDLVHPSHRYPDTNWWYAPSATWSQGPTSAWNFAKEECTFRAMGVFSDSSLTTSAASFLRSRSIGVGSWSTSALLLNSVL